MSKVITDICDQGLENLCAGIINNAVNDFFNSRFFIDLCDMRGVYTSKTSEKYRYNERLFVEAIIFFNSNLFKAMGLSTNTKRILKVLDDRYVEEEFPERLRKIAKAKKWPESYFKHELRNYEIHRKLGRLTIAERMHRK